MKRKNEKEKGRSPEEPRPLCEGLLVILLLALPGQREEEPVRAYQDRDEQDHD